jgi:hypothetical protein
MQRNLNKELFFTNIMSLPKVIQVKISDFLDNKNLASLAESNKLYYNFFKNCLEKKFSQYLESTPGITCEQFFRSFEDPDLLKIKNIFTNWCIELGLAQHTLEFKGTIEHLNLGLKCDSMSELYLSDKGKKQYKFSENLDAHVSLNLNYSFLPPCLQKKCPSMNLSLPLQKIIEINDQSTPGEIKLNLTPHSRQSFNFALNLTRAAASEEDFLPDEEKNDEHFGSKLIGTFITYQLKLNGAIFSDKKSISLQELFPFHTKEGTTIFSIKAPIIYKRFFYIPKLMPRVDLEGSSDPEICLVM